MTSANPTIPRPPSYYFKPVRVEPDPEQQKVTMSHQPPDLFEPKPEQQKVTMSHQPPDLFEPSSKRRFREPTPFPRPSTPPPTPFKQTPMTNRWLLDPMP